MWRGGLGAAYLFPPLSSGGASIAAPCSVFTSRPSNRTCGFPASGSPTAVAFRHTLPTLSRPLHLKAKLVPGSPGLSLEVIGLRHSPNLCSLPSAGITRLHRYYGPVRHPIRPGLALTGFRLVTHPHRWGFPCCVGAPCIHAVAITPACLRPSDRQAGPLGAPVCVRTRTGRRVAHFPNDGGLPRNSAGSAPASPFSRPAYHEVTGRPAQRSLTLRPAYSPSRLATLYTGGFGDFVAYVTAPIATDLPAELPAQAGWSNTCRVGLSPTGDPRLFTAH